MSWKSGVYRRASPFLPPFARDMVDLRLTPGSGLLERGWPQSRALGMPVDRDLNPLPWYTYPAIRFLERRIRPSAQVFEYGMGNSTLWWAERSARVTSCEHDAAWFERLGSRLPGNVKALLRPVQSDDYVRAAAGSERPVNILVIDGRRRVSCAKNALSALAPDGCIVWDNSDRSHYEPGFEHLRENGFLGRLDFWGMGPINIYEWCTSIFYRSGNCLGL